MKLKRVLEACLYTLDLEAAEHFYGTVLGLEVLARVPGRHVFFRCGPGVFLVFNPAQTAVEQPLSGGVRIPAHGSRGPGHVAFAVSLGELARWRQRLQAAEVVIEAEAEVAWPAGGHSLYVRDPAGNSLELATPSVWGLPEESEASGQHRGA